MMKKILQQRLAANPEIATQELIAQYLSAEALERLKVLIQDSEQQHTGQILLCIEASLSPEDLQHYPTPRERALALFGEFRVWDTEDNNGVMLYLLLDRHAIELVADRALHRRVPQSEWDSIAEGLAAALRASQYESGLQAALEKISELLIAHFPATAGQAPENTVSDTPVLLR